MEHHKNCIEVQEWHKKATYDYVMDWPNHCRHCGGWGYFEYTYDPSPPGISLSSGYMTDADPCPECVEKGICPRCGETVSNMDDYGDNGYICPECGYEELVSEGVQDAPGCECWIWDTETEW